MFRHLLQGAAAALTLTLALTGSAGAAAPTSTEYSRLPVVDSVDISPDGKHIAAVSSPDGVNTVIEIWATDAMDQKPAIIPPGPGQRYVGVQFVKNARLAVSFRQLVTLDGTPRHLFQTIFMSIDPAKLDPKDILPPIDSQDPDTITASKTQPPTIISLLPNDPRHVMVADDRPGVSAVGVERVDVYTGAVEHVIHGAEKIQGYTVDLKGDVRLRQLVDTDGGKLYISTQYKDPQGGQWNEIFRHYTKDRDAFDFIGFTDDPNILLVRSNQGQDKAAIYDFDVRTKKIVDTAFGHPFFDADDVRTSTSPKDYGAILGFVYAGDRERTFWNTDSVLGQDEDRLRTALKVQAGSMIWNDQVSGKRGKIDVMGNYDVGIISYSDDLTQVIVVKQGPQQPPEYYLLQNGQKLTLLGKERPWIDSSSLGETTLVQYTARDGLVLPAYVTKPPKSFGPGPYPAIVLPHGGPWARDFMTWDPSGLAEYFAARGYVIIQPQFRGSLGWGQKIWLAGDAEWGQKMQDDVDDAAKWLIAQNLADPHRIALHGYSYGGYVAFAGAIHPNGLYRCAIAGAGVTDITTFQNRTYENRFTREGQSPTIKGFSPMAHASEVQIPLFVYYGSRDQTVPISESRNFVTAAKSSGKPVKALELSDMGHDMSRWSPDTQKQVLDSVDDFLKTECQMGGQ